jgi:hypothetical protein
MVRGLEGEKLDGWIQEAEVCNAPALRNFAAGLRKDLDERGRMIRAWARKNGKGPYHPNIVGGPEMCLPKRAPREFFNTLACSARFAVYKQLQVTPNIRQMAYAPALVSVYTWPAAGQRGRGPLPVHRR